MANIFQKLGSAFGQYGMDNRVPADEFLNLPKGDRRQMQIQGLQNFANQMNLVGAQQSGNAQRISQAQNVISQRRAEDEARALKAQQEAEFQKQYNLLSPEQKILVDRRRVGIDLPQGSERKIIKGADGFNYYTDTGERVLPGVVTNPEASKRTTIKGADGYNYFVDTGERVLPGVEQEKKQSERKYEKAADGFYRYVDDGSKVFGGVEVPTQGFEITTTDILGAQKDERKTFEATNKGVKNFQQLLDAAKAADGAASYALMIKFIKQLDDSVVREGEVATFGGFQGALTNLKNQISKTSGEGFTPKVKANMINLAAQTANRLVNDYNIYKAGKEASYDAIGFDPNMIFAGLDFNLGDLDLSRQYTPNDFEFIEYE